MYLAYYNLSAKPFQIDSDPRFLWLGSDHKEALANLRYGLLESSGYVVLVGPVGTGKTTLVNALLQMLDERVLVANVNYPSLDSTDFLSFVARLYDSSAPAAGKADCLLFLKAFMERIRAQGKVALLVIDEAHRLSEELLEEIRLLSNMEKDGEKLIRIFFVGQTELKSHLLSSHCRALRQRVTLFYHLQPLSEEDTSNYIDHRLRVAGGQAQIFSPRAIRAIYKYSRGNPRLINKICDRALLTGYVKEQPTIQSATILESVRELSQIDPIPTRRPLNPWLRMSAPPWWRRIGWREALLKPRSQIAGRIKRVVTVTSAKAVAIRSAAQEKVSEFFGIIRRSMRPHGWSFIAISALAALVWIGGLWLQNLHHWQDDPAGRRLPAENPESLAQEEYMPASLISETPKPSAQGSDQVTAKPAAAPKPAPPSTRDLAAAMLVKNDFQSAIQLIESNHGRSAGSNPELDHLYAKALTGRAAQLMTQSPTDAETMLRKAVSADPSYVEAPVALGNYYTKIKEYARAIGYYQTALQLDPHRTEVLFNLGFIFATTGMYVAAEETLEKLVQLKPDFVDKALFNLAVVQQKLGKPQESVASLEEAVTLRPENDQAQAFLKELRASQQEHR
ncbi:MAG: AAA family ATPase [Desulfobacteraceae bacterium]|nr:AAA family ATPase [Desulfobacteraceae bacterium]